jgi:hypothetical protein
MSGEPKKAYYIERITRGVTTALVYADNPEDAKRRYLEGEYDGTKASTESEGRGWGRIRRSPDDDRAPDPRGGAR